MGRRVAEQDWDDDEDSDDDEPALVACRYCRKEILEDAPYCPYCDQYQSEEDDAPSTARPWWFIIGFLLCLYILFRWISVP